MSLMILCSGVPGTAADVTVAAASDLQPLQSALIKGFTHAKLRFSFGSSGMLARQIENGAPFDVYLSANEAYVRQVSARLRQNTVVVYALGRLGLWSKSARRLEDLALLGRIAIANPAHAPYGAAAKEALVKMGLWDRLQPKLVFGENVQQAWQFAITGNADAAITSWSLMADKGGVPLPPELYTPIRQTGAVVRAAPNPDGGRQFLTFLTGPDGRRILSAAGFSLPPGPVKSPPASGAPPKAR